MIVGLLGGGQLGRMLALAGIPLGLKFRTLDPARDAATDPVAEHIVGEYDDYAALADFLPGLDVATYEFENVPVTTTRWLADRIPVYPPPACLEVAQDRLHEKNFFQRIGIPVPEYRSVETRSEFDRAMAEIGLPCVMKTRRFGYDGKGQCVMRNAAEVEAAWNLLGGRPLILEKLVPFERELSVLGVRGRDGTTAFYPLVENVHRCGILWQSTAPAPSVDPQFQALAESYAKSAMTALNYVGVLAIEFFAIGDQLLANEMAPRVHNSGHWTIEGAETSQFENHLRAVVGWPLGSTATIGCSRMLNLIGTLPSPSRLAAIPGAHVHLYGKSPRPGRKLGHLTIHAPDCETLERRWRESASLVNLDS